MSIGLLIAAERELSAHHTTFHLARRDWLLCLTGWRRMTDPPARCVIFSPRSKLHGQGFRITLQPLEIAG